MATKKSIWVLFGISVISAWVLVLGCMSNLKRECTIYPSLGTEHVATIGKAIFRKYLNTTWGPASLSDQEYVIEELVYEGSVGNVIYLTYRELYNGELRQLAPERLTYELSESNLIVFKDTKFKVIEVKATSIKYSLVLAPKVVRNFPTCSYMDNPN